MCLYKRKNRFFEFIFSKKKFFDYLKIFIDFSALLCYNVIHSSGAAVKNKIMMLFLALPLTMVEARKLKVAQNILRNGASGFA